MKKARKINIPEKYLKELKNNRMNSKAILRHLESVGIKMNDRQWRSFVRQYNDQFSNRDRYIASNSQGYILTVKKNDIVISNIQKIKTGVAMIRNAKATLKELADKNQLSLIKEEADIYDLAMKLKV